MDVQAEAQQAKALARAQAAGIRVVGQGAGWYAVSSSTDPDGAHGHYTVRVAHDGRTLECNCSAGAHGRRCKHEATVRAALAEEEQAAQEAAPRMSDAGWRDAYAQHVLAGLGS